MVNGKMKLIMPFRARTPGRPKARKTGAAKSKAAAATGKGKERAVIEVDDDDVEDDDGAVRAIGHDNDDEEDIDEADISTVWPPPRPSTRNKAGSSSRAAPTADKADLVTQCYQALLALRDESAIEADQPKDFMSDEAMQILAAEMPRSCGAIEDSLCVCFDVPHARCRLLARPAAGLLDQHATAHARVDATSSTRRSWSSTRVLWSRSPASSPPSATGPPRHPRPADRRHRPPRLSSRPSPSTCPRRPSAL